MERDDASQRRSSSIDVDSHLDPQHMTHGEMMVHRDGSIFLRYTHFTNPNLLSWCETWHSGENPSHPTEKTSPGACCPDFCEGWLSNEVGIEQLQCFFRVSFSQSGPKVTSSKQADHPQLDPLFGG